MDSLTPESRSRQMALVKSKNTRPEMAVRRMAYAMGYRYRLHVRGLPGSPDLVFSKRRAVILVHGCFWHHHEGCSLARIPKSRQEFWVPKLNANRQRDERTMMELEERGWRVLVIWECELRNIEGTRERLLAFLGTTAVAKAKRRRKG